MMHDFYPSVKLRVGLVFFAVWTSLLAVFGPLVAQEDVSPEEIIRMLDERQTFPQMKSRGRMIVHHGELGERSSSFLMYARGKFDTLLEFNNGAERGQKVLRTKDKLYLYSPRSADIILLQGTALRQSLGGGDVSYEDITSTQDTLDKYHVKLNGIESLEFQNEAVETWVVELEAKNRRGIAYPMQILYVIKDRYVPLRMEYFSRNKKLMKRIDIQEVKFFGDSFVISNMQIRDTLQNRGFTEVLVDEIDVRTAIAKSFFSLDSLSF